MIRFVTGNLFESDAFALVNTVNCEGFMGKGIAYQFKMRYPEMNDEYVKKCKSSKLKPGVLHIFLTGSKLIINFPTKNKWREKSKMEYISAGLDELVKLMTDRNIKSIAIPPLGCGNGGLNWCDVKTLIIQKMGCFDDSVSIFVFEPSKNYQSIPANEPQLSLSALILMKIKFCLDDSHFNKICLQKTAYFMTILSGTNYFRFVKDKYGPYDHEIEVISKRIQEYQRYHKVKSTQEAYDILMRKLISDNTVQKLEFYTPFIERAASFTNSLIDSQAVEGAGTSLYIIEKKRCANLEEVIWEFKQWSQDKANRFTEIDIISSLNNLEKAGFVEKTLCGYQIANN